jgi:4-amino-4-deoxy-L-arabinose transferase-like glycosyltransferase
MLSSRPDSPEAGFSLRGVRAGLEAVSGNPGALVGLLVVGQIAGWTLAPALTHDAPPLDVVEGYMWGREWVAATYKHPALPSWLLEASYLLTGAVGWPSYLIAQLFVAATFIFVFLLGCDLVGPQRAGAGTLLLTGIAYFSWPTVAFNHNIAEMTFGAALPWGLWRAVERRSIAAWTIFAALAAASLYAKLAAVILLVLVLAWIISDTRARHSVLTAGPWVGLGVFVILIAPLAFWLVAHDFAPLKYASLRLTRLAGDGVHVFLANVVLNFLPMLAMLGIAGMIGPRPLPKPSSEDARQALPPIGDRELRYLLLFTAGPLALTVIGATLSGSNVRSAWGSQLFSLVGLLAVALCADRFNQQALRRLAVAAAAGLIIAPVGYALVVCYRLPLSGEPLRVNWPQAEISARMRSIWAREMDSPLRIIAGETWIAGLIGIDAPDRPSVFTNGDPALSPWITQERLETEGMLVVWDTARRAPPTPILPLMRAPIRTEKFVWPRLPNGPELSISYVIVPPQADD